MGGRLTSRPGWYVLTGVDNTQHELEKKKPNFSPKKQKVHTTEWYENPR